MFFFRCNSRFEKVIISPPSLFTTNSFLIDAFHHEVWRKVDQNRMKTSKIEEIFRFFVRFGVSLRYFS